MITFCFQYSFTIAVCFYLFSLVFYLFHQSKISQAALLLGFVSHTLFQLSRGLFMGIWLPNPIFVGAYFLPWTMALISLGMQWFFNDTKNKQLILSIIIPISLFSLLAMLSPKGIVPPDPQHETIFVDFYFCVDTIAQACFILGAWLSFFHLIGKDADRLFNSFIIWGFIFYSISQVVGAYWAYLGWAVPFHWSTKHLQSATIWCYYAAVLHLRYFPTWNSKHEAWFSLGGFILLFVFIYDYQIQMMKFIKLGG